MNAGEYDVFISHASEDKDSVVDGLAQQLEALGVDVWYDDDQIQLGDSLMDSLDEGLRGSRYGIIVLSEDFIGKNWPESELKALMQQFQQDDVGIMPLRYGIPHEAMSILSPYYPTLFLAQSNRTRSKTVFKTSSTWSDRSQNN